MTRFHSRFAAPSVRGYRRTQTSGPVAAHVGRAKSCLLFMLSVLSLSSIALHAEPDIESINRTLAAQLVGEGDHDGAAIEYRRLALIADDAAARDGYRWLSAYEYLEDGNADVAVKVLDSVESRSGDDAWKMDLLRARAAEMYGNSGEETFYLNSIAGRDDLDVDAADYASRRLASALFREGRTNEARAALADSPRPDSSAIDALDEYMNGRDKSPVVGGWLGVIPGLGYAYAGEYANMTRSLILNALFIYAMVDTAEDEDWGAFTAITFFEITWYTGSIYGGIDASHRYNERRRQVVLDAVSGGVVMGPDREQIPAIQLKFRF